MNYPRHQLYYIRKELGFTIEEFAELTGIAAKTIRCIENRSSRYRTQLSVAHAIAETLDRHVLEIFLADELSHLGRPAKSGRPLSLVEDASNDNAQGVIDEAVEQRLPICPVHLLELPSTLVCDECDINYGTNHAAS